MNIVFNFRLFSLQREISISRSALQAVVISALLLIVTIVTYWGSVTVMLILIAIPIAGAGLYFSFRQPNLVYLLILLGGMFVPFAGAGGVNSSIIALLWLVVLWTLDMLVVKREFKFEYSGTIRPVLYFILICILSLGAGQVSWLALARQAPINTQLGGFAIYFLLPLTMLITPSFIKDLYWLKVIFWIFICLSMVYVTGNLLGFSFIYNVFQRGYTANSMLWTWLVTLMAGQAIYNRELRRPIRFLLVICLIVTLYVGAIRQYDWKSGWVPAAVALLVLVGLRFRKIVPFAIPFAFLVGIYLARDLISSDQYSWGTRLDAWQIVLSISSISPIIGLGFANYYWYAPLFPIRGYDVQFNSHSQFIDLIAQTGILGFLCFFWMLFEVARLAWRLSTRLEDGFVRAYAYSVLAGVPGCLMAGFLGDWILPFPYNIGLDGVRASILPWIFFGGLLSIGKMYLAHENPAK